MKKRKINDLKRMERRALLAHYMGYFKLERELWTELEEKKTANTTTTTTQK